MKSNTYIYDHISLTSSQNVKNFQTSVTEKIQTRVSHSKTSFPQNRPVYQIMWKIIADSERSQMTVWGIPIACWIPKSKNTHSECVILIKFLLQ